MRDEEVVAELHDVHVKAGSLHPVCGRDVDAGLHLVGVACAR